MNFTSQFHLSLKKGKKKYIFLHLVVNYIFLIKWKICKLLKGIHRPVIHLYAVCWNEERIVRFMLDHYDAFVDKFYIYDNGSTDQTLEFLSQNSKVKVIHFDSDNSFDDLKHIEIKNNKWKQSRGHADYVIVIDMDEFLYHPNMQELLKQDDFTIFKPRGYNMINKLFPKYRQGLLLTDMVKIGDKDEHYSKSVLFNPYKIVDINYLPGAHEAHPWGCVHYYINEDLKLLHYKNLSIDYVMDKIVQYRNRLSDTNIKLELAEHYLWEDSKIIHDFNQLLKDATEII